MKTGAVLMRHNAVLQLAVAHRSHLVLLFRTAVVLPIREAMRILLHVQHATALQPIARRLIALLLAVLLAVAWEEAVWGAAVVVADVDKSGVII